MKVPFNWLKEYVNHGLTPAELAERLTLAGIEVESFTPFRPPLSGVVVGLIKKVESHPGSKKLSVARVEVREGKIIQVVCGADNIAPGQKVPVALAGASLPGKKVIEKAEVGGILSEGMICSSGELGLEQLDVPGGIMVLDNGNLTGRPVEQIFELDEPILELDLTPNRADCLGMLGVAYEVASITGKDVRLPAAQPREMGKPVEDAAQVVVLDEELCPRYTARVIDEITLSQSPLWMRLRLLKAGIRPINNIVDITNYVMWEYGQPLHAFDGDLLKEGRIIVRRAQAGEKMVTLDGIERELDTEMLVIADSGGPIGLAGVMGGENTEINPRTCRVLLEAARFNPFNIRRTSRMLNLPSEASQRFERGVNPEAAPHAQNRASFLMEELAGGKVMRGMIDVNPSPPSPVRLTVRPYRINEILGLKIPQDEVISILQRLGFSVKRNGDGSALQVTVPLRRGDVTIEEDVVEEVARLYGYENIPVTLPRGELVECREGPEQRALDLTRDTLIACGFYEAITYSFVSPSVYDDLFLPAEDLRRLSIPLQNPLTAEQGVMRTTLLPGLLKVLQHNFSYQEFNQLIFETGAVYLAGSLPLEELPREESRLALAATGQLPEANWVVPSSQADFFVVKGALEAVTGRLHLKDIKFLPGTVPFIHPTRCALIMIDGAEAGFLGELHPAVAERWGIRQSVSVAEINMDLLAERANLVPQAASLSRHPAAWRDIAVVVSNEVPAEELENCIRRAGGYLVDRVTLFDLYEGAQVPEGKRSLAFNISYRRSEATLTDEEINEAQEGIKKALADMGAVLRR